MSSWDQLPTERDEQVFAAAEGLFELPRGVPPAR